MITSHILKKSIQNKIGKLNNIIVKVKDKKYN